MKFDRDTALCSLARLSPVRDRNKDINRQLRTFHTECARSPLLPVDSWLALDFVFVSKRPTTPEVLACTTDTFRRRPTSSSSDFGSHQSKEPLPPTIEANPDANHYANSQYELAFRSPEEYVLCSFYQFVLKH